MPVKSVALRGFGNVFEKELFDHLCNRLADMPGDHTIIAPFRIPGGGRAIDGLLLSPECVFTFEAKKIQGHVKKGANTPLEAWDENGKPIDLSERYEDPYDQAENQWKELSGYLRSALGTTAIWIKSVLVFRPGTTFDVPPETRDASNWRTSPFILTLNEVVDYATTLKPPGGILLSREVQDVIVKALRDGPHKISMEERSIISGANTFQNGPDSRKVSANTARSSKSKEENPGTDTIPAKIGPSTETYTYPAVYKKPWYRSTPFYVILLFFFWPAGALMILTDVHAPRILKGVALAAIAMFSVLLCLLAFALVFTFVG